MFLIKYIQILDTLNTITCFFPVENFYSNFQFCVHSIHMLMGLFHYRITHRTQKMEKL